MGKATISQLHILEKVGKTWETIETTDVRLPLSGLSSVALVGISADEYVKIAMDRDATYEIAPSVGYRQMVETINTHILNRFNVSIDCYTFIEGSKIVLSENERAKALENANYEATNGNIYGLDYIGIYTNKRGTVIGYKFMVDGKAVIIPLQPNGITPKFKKLDISAIFRMHSDRIAHEIGAEIGKDTKVQFVKNAGTIWVTAK